MWRLTERMVRSGLVMAWRLATSPTSTSPVLEKPTTDGVVRRPRRWGSRPARRPPARPPPSWWSRGRFLRPLPSVLPLCSCRRGDRPSGVFMLSLAYLCRSASSVPSIGPKKYNKVECQYVKFFPGSRTQPGACSPGQGCGSPDRRAPPGPGYDPAVPDLVLLRHGQSTWNAANLFTGWRDVELTEEGAEEARRSGRLLAGRDDLDLRVLHTSVLTRAIPRPSWPWPRPGGAGCRCAATGA